MNGPRRALSLTQNAINVHQAARIDRRHVFSARRFDKAALGVAHGSGDHAEFYGEGASEPAALLSSLHLAQIDVTHLIKKYACVITDSKLAVGVACGMVGNRMWED